MRCTCGGILQTRQNEDRRCRVGAQREITHSEQTSEYKLGARRHHATVYHAQLAALEPLHIEPSKASH